MKKALLAFLCLALAYVSAYAQTPAVWPNVVTSPSVYDFGNGPLKLRLIKGNAFIFTSQGSGTGSTSGSSTALTLTGTPATPPCVGCVIAGTGITAGTTVSAYNGTTSVTLSAAMTVPGGTALSWGGACPATYTSPNYIQGSPSADYWPLYTTARICATSPGGPSTFALYVPYTTTTSSGGGGSGITALTGDGTASGSGSVVFTLATVNGGVGTFGSGTQVGQFTVNAKGLITAASNVTVTPPFSAVTGQATLAQLPNMNANTVLSNWTAGSATPLSNVWPACANDGLHGLVYVNGTGLQCATITVGTGTVTSVGLSLGGGVFTVSGSPVSTTGTLVGTLATQTANTVFAGPSSAGPTAPTFRTLVTADMPTSVALNNATDQAMTGGFTLTPLSLSAGTFTPDCGSMALQRIINTGAFTINAPAPPNYGYCNIRVINGSGASSITLPTGSGAATGWLVGTNTGDTFSAAVKASASCTATNASPAVFTYTSHGLPNYAPVYLSGTTAPLGFTLGVVYYTLNVATNTFQMSSTPGGTAINSSSTGSSITCNAASQYTFAVENNLGGATYAWKALQ